LKNLAVLISGCLRLYLLLSSVSSKMLRVLEVSFLSGFDHRKVESTREGLEGYD
jgi:hypothetical protein